MSLDRPRRPQPPRPTAARDLSVARGRPRRRRPVRRPGHQRRHRGVGPEHRPRPRRPRRPARRGLRRDRPVARDASPRSPGRPASRSRRRPSSGGPTSARSLDAGDALPPPVTVLGIDPAVDAAAPRPRPRRRLAADATPASTAPSSPSASPRRTGWPSARRSTMQGAGDPVDYRVVGIVAGDGPLTGGRSGGPSSSRSPTAQAVFGETGVTRVDIGLERRRRPRRPSSAALEARLHVAAVRPVRRRRTSPPRCARRPPTSRRRPR